MHRLCAAAAALAAACSSSSDPAPIPRSPYPNVVVSGTIRDVRGGPVSGARVTVRNQWDTSTTYTAADGTFALDVDGSTDPSALEISHAAERTRVGTVAVGPTGASLGEVKVVSKEEILFASLTGDVYLVRADAAYPIQVLTNTGASEWTPHFSPFGEPKIRWAKTGTDQIEEVTWSGTALPAPTLVRDSEADWSVLGIDWSERGTIMWRRSDVGGAGNVTVLEDPPGQTFAYEWIGSDAAASPPSFEWMSAQATAGEMIAFAGSDGIYVAFPHFADSYFTPARIAGTQAGDTYPAWSPVRANGSLLLGFVRNKRIFVTEVSAGTGESSYSTPAGLYGNVATSGSEEPQVYKFDWAPHVDGQPDRIVVSVWFQDPGKAGVWDFGDVVKISVDPTSATVTGAPTRVYSRALNPYGSSMDVSWR